MKNKIKFVTLLSLLTALPLSVNAMCPTSEAGMSTTAKTMAISALGQLGINVNVKDNETEQAESVKTEEQIDCKTAINSDLEIKTTVYDKIADTILTKPNVSTIITANNGYNSAVDDIKKTFFNGYDEALTGEEGKGAMGAVAGLGESAGTTENTKMVVANRLAYVNDLASNYVALAYELRDLLKEDAISAYKIQTAGCDRLDGFALQNSHILALIKASASDVLVQMLLLESLAAQGLLKESDSLVTFEEEWGKDSDGTTTLDKVNETKSKSKSSGLGLLDTLSFNTYKGEKYA